MSQPENGCLPCSNCFVTVPQDKWFAVQKFGAYSHMLGPGLAFTGIDCCGCCISFRSITSRVEQKIMKVRTKTKDNVFVMVTVAVQHTVLADNVEAAMYKLQDVDSQIDSYVADVVRSHLPRMTIDEAFEKKDDISDACQEQLQKNMAAYGFEILKALVTELQPDAEVAQAMNAINTQKRLRDAAALAAEADKVKVVKAAEAQADAQHLQGQGIARQRAAIIDGLKDSICSGTGETLSSDKVSELLLITQYFETMRDIGASSRAQTVFIPSGAGAVGDISAQIRNGVLQAGAAASSVPGQQRM
jgi:regulator of protease activity HflC (stomatin/prohibitin superfamily)